MGEAHLKLTLTISCLCLLWISGLASLPSRYSLGIDPKGTCLLVILIIFDLELLELVFFVYLIPFRSSDLSYYKSNVIKCKDGSRKFKIEELNDDFCDCPDGTDEPGLAFSVVLLLGFAQNLNFFPFF